MVQFVYNTMLYKIDDTKYNIHSRASAIFLAIHNYLNMYFIMSISELSLKPLIT